jgi:hypothetical protein
MCDITSMIDLLGSHPEVLSSIPNATRFFSVAVGMERGPLSLVRINKELLE